MLIVIAAIAYCAPIVALALVADRYPHFRHPLAPALCVGLAMAGLGYGLYNTSEYSDLTRFMEQLLTTQGGTISQAIVQFSNSHMNDTPLAILWFWAIGQTGNAQLYPASIAFLEYTVLAYMLIDCSMQAGVTKGQFAGMLFLLIIATPVFDSVNSVRSTPALALGVLAIYLEYYKKKYLPVALFLYCCSPLIHSVGFIVFPIRVLCAMADRSLKLALVAAFLLLPVAYLLSDTLDPIFSRFGFAVAAKVKTYFSGDVTSEYAAHVKGSRFITVKRWATFVLLAVSVWLVSRPGAKRAEEPRELCALANIGATTAVIAMSFALFVVAPSYARFAYVAVPFLGVTFLRQCASRSRKVSYGTEIRLSSRGLLYSISLCAYLALSMINMSWRVDLYGFAMHLLFGFLGKWLV